MRDSLDLEQTREERKPNSVLRSPVLLHNSDSDWSAVAAKNRTVLLLLLLLVLLTTVVSGDDQPGEGVHPVKDLAQGFHIGDTCVESCSSVIVHSYCNLTSNTCQCLESHPIVIEGVTCADAKELHSPCVYDQQCKRKNLDSYCFKLGEGDLRCWCRTGFHPERIHDGDQAKQICVRDTVGPLTRTSVPTIVALCLSLSILSLLLCFMLRLFSSARWARTRRYADASCGGGGRDQQAATGSERRQLLQQQPPEIMLQEDSVSEDAKRSLDIEKQLYRPALYACNAAQQQQQQQPQGNPSSRNNSITASAGGGSQHSGGSDNGGSRRTSGQLLSEWPDGFTDTDTDYEQQITIVPNPKSSSFKRRGSMADHAFPELHSKKKKQQQQQPEPENLLILTRTRTDRHGRRHSVAVPLVPPPDGQKFEGGYHMERNPITGGAKLVPPPGAAGADGSRSGGSSRKSSLSSNKDKSPVRQSRERLTGRTGDATTSGRGRRHSIHVGSPTQQQQQQQQGTSGLTRDMERLRVSSAAGLGRNGTVPIGGGVSPRPLKRKSSRRSSRSGFLHFLDLAIAN